MKKISFFDDRRGRTDYVFIVLVLLITLYGTLMVFSAGTAYAEARYQDKFFFVKRQTIWTVVGLLAMYFSSKISARYYRKYTLHFYVATLLLLVLVLAVGLVGNGAQRWISLGPITIQPSEIAKLSMIMMLSLYFAKNEERATDRKNQANILIYGTLIPCSIMLIPIILVMLQRHLSCIIILGTIGLLMIFISGVNPKYIYAFCIIAAIGVCALALFTDYTKERITVWRDPEAYKLTGGWQTLQGLMAIGSGGIFGVGYGNSILKHCYVSEPANDMIFSILCEELGIVGAAIALILFTLLVARSCYIALRCNDSYARLLAFGISIKLSVQTLLNIAVVTNTIPNTGISLPFFSYGGSSLIMLFFEMGIILSIAREARISK